MLAADGGPVHPGPDRAAAGGRMSPWVRYVTVALAIAALAIGVQARFRGLGSRPLALDEYFFASSVEMILDQGVPRFETGGYYIRGVVPQYLTAATAAIVGRSELAYRLPAALFSLLAVVLTYVWGRRYLPRALAMAVAAALLLSSWHVEFAHFARMYAAFQVMTILFFMTLALVTVDAVARLRFVPHALAVLTTFTHALGVFNTPFLLAPLLSSDVRRTWGRRRLVVYVAVTMLTSMLCAFLATFDLRNLGVHDRLPADYVGGSYGHSKLATPVFPFWSVSGDDVVNLAAQIGAILLAAAVGLAMWRARRDVRPADVYLGCALAAAATHALLVAAAFVAVAVFLCRIRDPAGRSRYTPVLLALTVGMAVAWLSYGLAVRAELGMTVTELVRTVFLGWPDIWRTTYWTWVGEFPVLGAYAAVAVVVVLAIRARDRWEVVVTDPAFIVVYFVVCFGIMPATYGTTRYYYHIYPAILLTIAIALYEVIRRLAGRLGIGAPRQAYVAVGVFAILFATSGDFNPPHLARVDSREVTYRLAPFDRFGQTWYPRYDYRGPARSINADTAADVKVILTNVNPVAYYLDNREFVNYIDRAAPEFRIYSRRRGTVEVWSGRPLVGTPEDLRALTARDREVLIVRFVDPSRRPFTIEQVWGDRVRGQSPFAVGEDGRIEVIHVELGDSDVDAD